MQWKSCQSNVARIANQRPRIPAHVTAGGEDSVKSYLFGYQAGLEILKLLVADNVLLSMSWNKACVRVRLQF